MQIRSSQTNFFWSQTVKFSSHKYMLFFITVHLNVIVKFYWMIIFKFWLHRMYESANLILLTMIGLEQTCSRPIIGILFFHLVAICCLLLLPSTVDLDTLMTYILYFTIQSGWMANKNVTVGQKTTETTDSGVIVRGFNDSTRRHLV